jgi:fatty acid amide hydrolase
LSPLGVGTDIGGSIRVPAHFCGIAGLKPTLDRWPNLGLNTAIAGQEAIRAQVGPMARTARDVALFFGALDPRRMTALDPRVPPLAFDDPAAIDVSKLRVGYFVDDGLVPSSRAVSRAVVRAARALRARGATVVDFTPPDLDDAAYSYLAALSADGGRTAWAYLGDAEVDPALTVLRKAASLPGPVRRAAARVARAAGENRLARLLEAMGEKTVAELYRLVAHLRAYRANLLAAMEAAQIDVILGPPHATPAMQHTMSKDFTLAGSPSMLWNLVQFPAGVVATTRVRPGEAERPDRRDRLEKRAASVDEGSAGLPIGVQLAARPWQDHVVLAAMIALEDELAGDEERPVTPILSI